MKRLWYFLFLSLIFGANCTERQLRKGSIQSERGTVVKTVRIDNQIELRITDNTKLNPSFQIIRLDNQQTLWETPVGEKRPEAFLQLGSGEQYRPPISNGNYQVNFTLTTITNGMKIDSVEKHEARFFQATDELNESILIKGSLLQCSDVSSNKECEKKSDFTFTFNFIGKRLSSGYDEKELKKNLNSMTISFSVSVTPVSSLEINEIHTVLTLSSNDKESFHGFGESFTYFDLAGLNVPILVSEQGVGRDEQPITDYLNKAVGEGVGGHWYTTYAPKPLFTTNYNRSLALEITETSFFDLTKVRSQNYFTIDVWSDHFSGKLMNSDSMIESVSKISEFTGKQSVLPRWTQEGAIVGLEGGTENVTRIVNDLLAGGVPVVGVWLQDWVGLRHSWDGDRLIWNWELNNDYYPNWEEMTSNWKKQGIRVLTYLNPFFSDPSGFVNDTELRHNFYQEGLEKGYFVKQANGSTYLMYSLSIEFATLDMTNPEARAWMKNIIINQTLIEAHSSGWMCDFGEYLPFDAVMANGQTGSTYHNYYPQAWAELTAEAVKEYNEQQGITENEIMYFMRSAWTWSPAYVPAFWLGDQLMSWDGNDGIKTVITGALSSGLTGHTITHSDIGGYTAEIDFENSQLNYIRSPELLKRWSELGAFGFGLFRTHIGSSTNSVVAQIYDSPDIIAHFAQFATIHAQLADYRTILMKEAAEKGLPMIRYVISDIERKNRIV